MQPSSFVFVAIVGLWAAYLLPQWIRRRDALGAARGGDRHSLALRVLERRVRRRRPGRSSAPLLAPRAGGDAPQERIGTAPFVSIAPTSATTPGFAAARRRAVVLALLTLATGAATATAVGGIVPGALVGIPAGLLLADIVVLRRRARRPRRPSSPVRVSGSVSVSRPRRPAAPERMPARVPAQASARHAVTDVAEPLPAVDAAAQAVGDGGWLPVPVPPPTYTLKPVAPRPEPAPLEPFAVPTDPAMSASGTSLPSGPRLVAEQSEVDLDTVLQRRRAVNG